MIKNTWVLVGDGSHARLFSTNDPTRPWALAQKFDREHSHEKTNRSDSHEDKGEHDFARHLVAALEAGRENHSFEQLVLVAPARFLGQLRSELAAPLAALVVHSLDKDYTHLAEADLHQHIKLPIG